MIGLTFLFLGCGLVIVMIFYRDKSSTAEKGSGTHAAEGQADESADLNRERSLVPFCRGLDLIPSYPSILDLNQIVFINAHLPQQYQLEWRFLFSSEIHGESFATLIGKKLNY